MNAAQFRRFIIQCQGDLFACGIDDAKRIVDRIRQLCHCCHFVSPPGPSSPSTTSTTSSSPAISTLTLDPRGQFSSDCNDVSIIKVLQRGVRVTELDMWPNSTKDDLDILHGRMSRVSMKDDQDEEDTDSDDHNWQQNSVPEFERLITITASKPKGQSRVSLHLDPTKVRHLSLSRQELVKAAKSHGADLVRCLEGC